MTKVSKYLAITIALLFFVPFASYHLAIPVNAVDTYLPEITTVDPNGEVGQFSSLSLDRANNPHIGYFDSTNQDLKYASWNGSNWIIETVDSEGAVGEYCSLALDSNDNPHISYFDSLNKDLKYAIKDGSSWSIEVVDSGDCDLYATSMALDSTDKPHIIYTDYIIHRTNSTLKYATWTGSVWSIQTVDLILMAGPAYCSIALDSMEYAHISYHDDNQLNYAAWNGSHWNIQIVDGWNVTGVFSSNFHDDSDGFFSCANWNGSHWNILTRDGLIVLDDFTASAGYFSSIILDSNGKPRIAYFSGELRYAVLNGLSWDIQTVDGNEVFDSVSSGWYPSIALNSKDEAHISYFNRKSGLYYAIQTNSGWSIQALDITGNAYSSIAVDPEGYTHISYYERYNGDLKYIVLSSDPIEAVTSSIQPKPDSGVKGTFEINQNKNTYTFADENSVEIKDTSEKVSEDCVDPNITLKTTFAFISLELSIVDVNQAVRVNMFIEPPPPTSSQVFQGITLTITCPSGKVYVLGPYLSDSNGSQYTFFTPEQFGNYTFQLHFPRQLFKDAEVEYEATDSPIVTLTFNSQPVTLSNSESGISPQQLRVSTPESSIEALSVPDHQRADETPTVTVFASTVSIIAISTISPAYFKKRK